MSGRRTTALVAMAGAAAGCALWLAPAAFAVGSALDGQYMVTFSANQKTGTSVAARMPESAQWAKYSFTSSCSTGGLRRQGQRRAGLHQPVRAAVGPLHLERVAVDRASDLAIRLPLSRRPGGTRPGPVGRCPERRAQTAC